MSPLLKFVMTSRILFGLNYKCKYRYLSIILKVYCVLYYVYSIIGLVRMSYVVWAPEICTFVVITAELTIQVFSSLISEEEYFDNYCKAIENLDDATASGLTVNSLVVISLFFIQILLLLSSMIASYHVHNYSIGNILSTAVLYMAFGTKGGSQFITFAILDILRLRVKFLKKNLNNDMQLEISDQEKSEVLNRFAGHYRYLLKSLESTHPHPIIMVTSLLIAAYLKVLLIIYHVIANPIQKINTARMIWMGLTSFEVLIISVPAILLEMVSNEIDQIKVILADQLLVYTDLKYRRGIYSVVEYLTVAPPTVTVWSEFTVNLALYIDFIGLCVCYCIMTLQFEY